MLSKILKNNIYFNSLQKNTKIKIIFIDSYENDHRTNFLSLISKQIKYYYIFKRSFEKITHKPDHIYINSFNTIDKILPLFGSPFGNTKISGFVSSIKFHLKQKNSYKSRFKRLIKSFLIFFVKGILFSRVKNLIFKIN